MEVVKLFAPLGALVFLFVMPYVIWKLHRRVQFASRLPDSLKLLVVVAAIFSMPFWAVGVVHFGWRLLNVDNCIPAEGWMVFKIYECLVMRDFDPGLKRQKLDEQLKEAFRRSQ